MNADERGYVFRERKKKKINLPQMDADEHRLMTAPG